MEATLHNFLQESPPIVGFTRQARRSGGLAVSFGRWCGLRCLAVSQLRTNSDHMCQLRMFRYIVKELGPWSGTMGVSFSRDLDNKDLRGKTVVITGCDTGFGRATTLALLSRGVSVYAGCLTQQGIASLSETCSANIQKYPGKLVALYLDVTSDESVKTFTDVVKADVPEGIFALVNNAGILSIGPLEVTPFATQKAVFEVNYFGTLRMLYALLPSLRDYVRTHCTVTAASVRPRIVNVASVAGRFASKNAVRAATEALRVEVAAHGIDAVLIEPFYALSPMLTAGTIDRALIANYANADQEVRDAYPPPRRAEGTGTENRGGGANLAFVATQLTSPLSIQPAYVVKFIERAVVAVRPPRRYLVGAAAWILVAFQSITPPWLTEWVTSILQAPISILPRMDKIRGLALLPDFITPSQERHLAALIEAQEWGMDLKRRTQHYGYKYGYRTRRLDPAPPIPEWLLPTTGCVQNAVAEAAAAAPRTRSGGRRRRPSPIRPGHRQRVQIGPVHHAARRLAAVLWRHDRIAVDGRGLRHDVFAGRGGRQAGERCCCRSGRCWCWPVRRGGRGPTRSQIPAGQDFAGGTLGKRVSVTWRVALEARTGKQQTRIKDFYKKV
ncbi:hypothetical protein DFJ73DRAFT_755569 [Zopfochytrium polystomum]|nr:hypothetical protein DFJ73DRAFT_755569 [Zopfochytrium polystomum]